VNAAVCDFRLGAHHFAAGLQRQSQHPDVYVQLIAQAAERGRRETRESGAWLIAEHHSQPLENPVDGPQQSVRNRYNVTKYTNGVGAIIALARRDDQLFG